MIWLWKCYVYRISDVSDQNLIELLRKIPKRFVKMRRLSSQEISRIRQTCGIGQTKCQIYWNSLKLDKSLLKFTQFAKNQSFLHEISPESILTENNYFMKFFHRIQSEECEQSSVFALTIPQALCCA